MDLLSMPFTRFDLIMLFGGFFGMSLSLISAIILLRKKIKAANLIGLNGDGI
jgi:hypothetical protein